MNSGGSTFRRIIHLTRSWFARTRSTALQPLLVKQVKLPSMSPGVLPLAQLKLRFLQIPRSFLPLGLTVASHEDRGIIFGGEQKDGIIFSIISIWGLVSMSSTPILAFMSPAIMIFPSLLKRVAEVNRSSN